MKYDLPLVTALNLTRSDALWVYENPCLEATIMPLVHNGRFASGRALLDTGAATTNIRQSVIDSLGLVRLNGAPASTSRGTSNQTRYGGVSIQFPQTPFPPVTVPVVLAAVDDPASGVVFIIGKDALRYFKMEYDGPGGHVFLEIPD